MAKVTIVLLTKNNIARTKRCLSSLMKAVRHPYKILVVDSASNDGTQDYIKSLSEVELIENRRNIRPPTAINQAIQATTNCDYICKLDNDTISTEDWLSKMVKAAEMSPRIGIVGAKLLREDGSIQHAGGFVLPFCNWLLGHCTSDVPTRFCPWVTGACFLIKKTTIEQIGLFDERYPFWYDDTDYCFAAREKKFKVLYCRDAVLYHYKLSMSSPRPEANEARRLFLQKWAKKIELWHNEVTLRTLLWGISHDWKFFITQVGANRPLTLAYSRIHDMITRVKTLYHKQLQTF